MKKALTWVVCLSIILPFSCGQQDELGRAVAAMTDLNEYVNSHEYRTDCLDLTTENGDTDYQALYGLVSSRYLRVVQSHGFESVDQWLEAVDRYREDETMSAARSGYTAQADDVIETLRHDSEFGHYEEVPDEVTRAVAAFQEISDYVDSDAIDMVYRENTYESGIIDYPAVYEAVAGKYLEIVNRHGFRTVSEWVADVDYYTQMAYDELAEFDYRGLDLLYELEDMCAAEYIEEPQTRMGTDSIGGPFITSTGDDDMATDAGEK
jgi:hypothetical protein